MSDVLQRNQTASDISGGPADVIVTEQTPPAERPFFSPDIITDEKELENVVQYLLDERDREIENRADLLKQWQKWRDQAEAMPSALPKNSPLETPSRVSPPLTMIHNQTMSSQMIAYYSSKQPFWKITAVNSNDAEKNKDAEAIERCLEMLARSPNDLNIAEVIPDVALEQTLMGTEIVKVVWERNEWNFRTNDLGGNVSEQMMKVHDGPSIIATMREDVIYPVEWSKWHLMPWVSHELHLPVHEIEARSVLGIYGDVKKVIDWARDEASDQERGSQADAGYEGSVKGIVDLCEFTFFWDVPPADGVYEDLVFVVHPETKTVLRQQYNTLGVRRFQNFKMIPRQMSIEGRGIGQICETLQDEVEGIHNVRNDNIKLAMARMLVMRRSVVLNNNEKIFGGKRWIADNPKEDIFPFQMADEYSSSLASENMTWSLAAQGTGVSEVTRGFSDPRLGSRDTWRGQQMRAQNGANLTSTIMDTSTPAWARVGMLVFMTIVENKEDFIANEQKAQRMSQDDLTRITNILNGMDVKDVPMTFKFAVQSTDEGQTYYDQTQGMLRASQMFTQWAQQSAPLAQMVFGPQGVQMQQQAPDLYKFLLEMLVDSTRMLKRILKLFKIDDTENYVPDMRKQEIAVQAMNDMMTQVVGGRAQNEPQINRAAGPSNVQSLPASLGGGSWGSAADRGNGQGGLPAVPGSGGAGME